MGVCDEGDGEEGSGDPVMVWATRRVAMFGNPSVVKTFSAEVVGEGPSVAPTTMMGMEWALNLSTHAWN
jgi:hypothetical protein